jgi:hypothetical protein
MCRGEVANGSVCLDGCARKTAGGWSLERSGGVAAVCWGCVGGSEWSLGYVWENGEWIMNIWQIKERKNNRKEKRKKPGVLWTFDQLTSVCYASGELFF